MMGNPMTDSGAALDVRRRVTAVPSIPRSLVALSSVSTVPPASSNPSKVPERSMSVSSDSTTRSPAVRPSLPALSRPSRVLCSSVPL